jgi:fumarate hydratase class II
MLVTCLSPSIGYDNAALVAKTAFKNNKTLRETVEALGIMSGEEFDRVVKPEKMV